METITRKHFQAKQTLECRNRRRSCDPRRAPKNSVLGLHLPEKRVRTPCLLGMLVDRPDQRESRGYPREVEERGRGSQSLAPSHTTRKLQMASSQSSPPGETGVVGYTVCKKRKRKKERTILLDGSLAWVETDLSAAESSTQQRPVGTTVDEPGIWRRDVEGDP